MIIVNKNKVAKSYLLVTSKNLVVVCKKVFSQKTWVLVLKTRKNAPKTHKNKLTN